MVEDVFWLSAVMLGLAGERGLAVVAIQGVGGEGGGGDDAAAGGQQEGDAADFGDHVGFLSDP